MLAVAGERFDIVHATLPIPAVTVYQPRGGTVPALWAARSERAGFWSRLGGRLARPLNIARRLTGEIERLVVEDERIACVGVSQMVAREFQVYYGREHNVHVAFNGVEVPDVAPEQRAQWRGQWRQAWRAGDSETVLLLPAQNFALKGVAQTIRALADASCPGARLVVVGADNARPYVRLARRLGVHDRVQFEPAAESLFPLYSAADGVILLSWYDACSRVVLEALRWGVPSLTTRLNGASELLTDGAGIVVDSPRDISSVAGGMGQLADTARRAAMAEACLAKAHLATLERQVERLESIYMEVVRR